MWEQWTLVHDVAAHLSVGVSPAITACIQNRALQLQSALPLAGRIVAACATAQQLRSSKQASVLVGNCAVAWHSCALQVCHAVPTVSEP